MNAFKSIFVSLVVAVACLAQIPITYSPNNPSPNAPGGNCTITSAPVYNYLSGIYFYCAPNSGPPLNLGTWTSYTPYTGTGATIVKATGATLVSPTLSGVTYSGTQAFGAITATTFNGNAITTGTGTLTLATGKTLTASNTLTLAGTDSTTMTFPTTSATIARTDAANTFTGVQTMTSAVLTTPAISAPTGLVVDCASTAACPSTARGLRMVMGIGTLSSGTPSTYAVTTISPAFTGTTTYNCYAQDATTIANNIGVLTAGYVSGSAVTFTGPNTNTDTFRFTCVGY